MAAAPAGFSWVNYTSTSVIKKDEEDIAIIKSHAMRVIHRERKKHPQKFPRFSKKLKKRELAPKAVSVDAVVQLSDPLLYQPATDWEGQAICQFAEDFVYPQLSANTAYPYLSFLPGLWNRYSERSCLTEAISAVALARFANQNCSSDLAFRARKVYAAALKLVNETMKDPELRKSDRVLATLCTLTKYEIVSGDVVNNRSLDSHERGQAALIIQRGEDQLKTEIGAALFRLVFTRQCMNCMAQGRLPAIASTISWESAFPAEGPPDLRKVMELYLGIATLRYRARINLTEDPASSHKEASRIANEALRLDGSLISYMNDLPPIMKYESVSADWRAKGLSNKSYFPSSMYVFRDVQQASFHHVTWYGRIHILQTLLEYSRYQLKYKPEELRLQLQETVNEICESIPYALSDRDSPKVWINIRGSRAIAGHYLIWVLAAASNVAGVPEAQREWIRQRLKHIGFVHGMRQALGFA